MDRRCLLIVSLCLYSEIAATEATCNKDQITACRSAAVSGQLGHYAGSGQCVSKPYVQYTHLCTVSDYLPSVDHCCCPLSDDRLLCCRYHQDWYHFRCMDTDDVIDLSPGDGCRWPLTSWRVILPIVVLSFIVIALVAVLYACWRIRNGARCRSIAQETSTDSSEYSLICRRCCNWNGLDEKAATQPPTSTTRPPLSSAVCPRSASLSASSAPVYTASSSAMEPSAPPASNYCSTMTPNTNLTSVAEAYCCPACLAASSLRCPHLMCDGVEGVSTLPAVSTAVSSSGVSSGCCVNRTCACGAHAQFHVVCSPGDTDDQPPPSYEISQQLHGRPLTPC